MIMPDNVVQFDFTERTKQVLKTIWIINHYAANQFIEHGGRHYYFAKNLIRAGYNVRIICASTIHNTTKNLIDDEQMQYTANCDGIAFIFVKCRNYAGNGISRVINMIEFYKNVLKMKLEIHTDDVIIGSSVHPLSCVAAIKLGRRHKCRVITEIRDLWPETIVAYGMKTQNSPTIQCLYGLEKWIYTKSDAIIFTMEGGRNYIIDKNWDLQTHGGSVDLNKVYHINNGVDLEKFDYNRNNFILSDSDLDNQESYKVIYTGSIRLANNVGVLVDVAEKLNTANNNVIFLIYGEGDELGALRKAVVQRGLSNIIFKGKVEKKYIPYILSCSDLNLLNYDKKIANICRYGSSQNKLFEYLASGKPVLSNIKINYSIVEGQHCGLELQNPTSDEYAKAIFEIASMAASDYSAMCERSRKTAQQYDFTVLTEKLIKIIEGIS